MSSIDHYYMHEAQEVRKLSPDPSTKVGAVVVKGDRQSSGCNTFPKGVLVTDERMADREEKYPRVVHAELNAILYATSIGIRMKGATIYSTCYPCASCCGAIIQAGIDRVVTLPMTKDYASRWADQVEISTSMFKEAGVKVCFLLEK